LESVVAEKRLIFPTLLGSRGDLVEALGGDADGTVEGDARAVEQGGE
jgi:hypothetical protein